jgi:hypothetical protein
MQADGFIQPKAWDSFSPHETRTGRVADEILSSDSGMGETPRKTLPGSARYGGEGKTTPNASDANDGPIATA